MLENGQEIEVKIPTRARKGKDASCSCRGSAGEGGGKSLLLRSKKVAPFKRVLLPRTRKKNYIRLSQGEDVRKKNGSSLI